MEKDNLNHVMNVISGIREDKKEYLNHYLKNAPRWFLESMEPIYKDKNSIFVEEGHEINFVYILIEGTVRAIDYRIFGMVYDYMWFDYVKTFGGMEILLKLGKYKTTLKTVTPCIMLKVERSKYESWMLNDMNALHMEIEDMGKSLLEQARKERVFLFLQGMDRLMYFFMDIYEKNYEESEVIIKQTRKEISERTGLSVKTINRAIVKLEENKFISKKGPKIKITKEEYKKILDYISPLVDEM